MCIDAESFVDREVLKYKQAVIEICRPSLMEPSKAHHVEKSPPVVQVKGIGPEVSEHEIKSLFEDRRRSGGGALQHITLSPDKTSACLTFEREDGKSIKGSGTTMS